MDKDNVNTYPQPDRWSFLWLVILVCLASLFPAQVQARQADPDFSSVDPYIEAQMKELHIPGLALAVVQGDQAAYVQGYGKAGPGKGPVTPQTSFMIGSTTKAFTALAIMQLVEAGKIELDTPVQAYLPWFRVADEQASAQITVRHLLNQTSGFSNAAGLKEEVAHDLSDNAIETSVRRLAEVGLVRSPGAAHEYSNVNFSILGLIVQTVSGQSYESYIQEHIFDPLEMGHSFTSQDKATKNGMSSGYITWLGFRLPVNVPFNRGNLPNGFLICSGEDMAHYLIALLNAGRYGNVSVLSPEGMAAMHQPAVPSDTPGEYYGMAWYVGEDDGVKAVFHTGENSNFQTFIIMLPDEKLGVAVMMNVDGLPVKARAEYIAKGVMALVKGKQPQPYAAATNQMFFLAIGSVIVPVAVALLWISWTVYRFIRRRKLGIPARRSAWWYIWVIVLPLIVDIGLLLVLLAGIPSLWGLPLGGMALFFADMFTLVALSVAALGVWGLARTLLTLKQAKSQPQASL